MPSRGLLCASLLAATALSSPGFAAVLPTGGRVVAGSAVIGAPQGGSLKISQSSAKAIIDWNGFSIGQGGAVAFANGKGATLNRVTGASVSSLDGLLTATGSVYLINPNGVIIGKSGVVDVGGTFVASILDTSNLSFLAGGALSFTGSSNAEVVNYGKIGALGGDVALIAARVENDGSISAVNGDAGLLAGYKVVLKDASLDEGRFAVELGGAGVSATNSGLIAAADAELRAEGGNVYALAGDTAGVIRATGVKGGGGKVWLVADGGTLDVAGALEAQAKGGAAGAIETSGQTVKLGAATINAHGGTWLLDPNDLTIDVTAATTIDNALNAGTSVTEQTTATGTGGAGTVNTAGNGDIIVAAPLTWTTNAALTLSALRNVTLNPASLITSTGGGAVTLQADNTGTGVGTVNFGLASGVSTSGAVTIFYNPVSYSDAATKSTQSYGGGGQGSRNYANPYTSNVSGGGTLLAYMLVNSLSQLEAVSTELDGVYALTHDLDASSSATMNPIAGGGFAGWTPIGAQGGAAFTGTLNGQGHVINGLYINGTASEIGLFGSLGEPALVSNLGVTNANVTGTGDANGILAGIGDGSTTFVNVYTTGTISGFSDTGGLYGKGGTYISNSYSTAAVSGGGSTGGLAGNATGALTNVYATGAVHGTSQSVGGLVGYFTGSLVDSYATGAVSDSSGGDVGGLLGQAGGSVTGSYATGSVTDTGGGDQNVGGLIGVATGNGNGSLIYNNIYAAGAVTSAGGQVGGLIGQTLDSAIVMDAFATGSVTAVGPRVGGLIGINDGPLSRSYASGAVSSSGDVGGLVGFNSFFPGSGGSITDSYATGSVTGVQSSDPSVINYVGGLVGTNNHYPDVNNPAEGSITRSYATGAVSGVGVLGGLVGGNSGAITNAIWDRTSTGQANGVGVTLLVNGSDTSAVTNLTSVQDTAPTATDYAFSNTSYTNAGFQFGTTPGGTASIDGVASQTWVQIDTDGSFNGSSVSNPAVATRPFLLMEYSPTITNAHQLQLMELSLGAAYKLASDVDASGTATTADMWGPGGFVSVGNDVYGSPGAFTGSFVGQGHAIAGLSIDSLYNRGLFGFVGASGSIVDLNLTGGSVSGFIDVGDLAGLNQGTISNVAASGAVSGVGRVGGLVGDNQGSISGSSASGSVSEVAGSVGNGRTGDLGGLAGDNSGSIMASFATGAVSAISGDQGSTGGLVGVDNASGGGAITNVHATGAVSGVADVGGLIGMTFGATQITGSYATGSVTASGVAAGGLIGETELDTSDSGAANGNATIKDSFATGAVTGTSDVGGLIGDAQGLTVIAGSAPGKTYASGSVTGTGNSTGGLVGENAGTITLTSYTPTGAGVSGFKYAGGLVGSNDTGSAVADSSSSGTVFGSQFDVGGLVGLNEGAITNSNASGAIGNGSAGGIGGLVGENQGQITGASASGAVNGVADVGGLVGVNKGEIGNSFATGAVTGLIGFFDGQIGGLAGSNTGSIRTSYAIGQVSGTNEVGGLVGALGGGPDGLVGTITGSYATGAVSGTSFAIGGLVGLNSAGSVLDSHASGDVQGASQVGGLVGENLVFVRDGTTYPAIITGSTPGKTYASGSVAGTGSSSGGLVGENNGMIENAAYTPTGAGVTGAADAGGAIGLNDAGGAAFDVFVTASVVGTSYTGGVVGDNFGGAANISFDGSVLGGGGVGGLAGVNEGGSTLTGTVGANLATTVKGTGDDVGGVAGASFAAITGGENEAKVTGRDDVGGLVGYNAANLIGSSHSAVSGRNYVGGVVGLNYGSIAVDVSGMVNGAEYVGGLVGWNDAAGSVSGSGVAGSVTVAATGDYAGGLVGVNKGTMSDDVTGNANTDSVTAVDYVGGLVGLNQGAVSYSSALVPVTGDLYVGGLVGWNDTGATINTSYATGTVTGIAGGQDASGNDYVGGLVGVNFGSIADTYATGAVSGVQVVGGLVGTNMPGGASVSTSYATGAVTASRYAAGATFGVQAGEVTSVYGFPTLSGQPVESGYYNAGATGDGTDLTAAQEDGSAAYAGFDFTNTWQSNPNGSPTLKSPTF